MNTDGGFIDIPAAWVVNKPSNLSFQNAMLYGTAGFTAALSVKKIVDHGVKPEDGKEHIKDQLLQNGACEVIHRNDLTQLGAKMLAKPVWAAAIDTVGRDYLSSAVKATAYNGCVTGCGNVASPDFELNVYPFILRGVSLYGIDSVQCKMPLRIKI